MAYVRPKVVRGVTYYALVEGFRDPDNFNVTRQRTLASLGREPDPVKALAAMRESAIRLKDLRGMRPKDSKLAAECERVKRQLVALERFVHELTEGAHL